MKLNLFDSAYLALIKEQAKDFINDNDFKSDDKNEAQIVSFKTTNQALIDALQGGFEKITVVTLVEDENGNTIENPVDFNIDSIADITVEPANMTADDFEEDYSDTNLTEEECEDDADGSDAEDNVETEQGEDDDSESTENEQCDDVDDLNEYGTLDKEKEKEISTESCGCKGKKCEKKTHKCDCKKNDREKMISEKLKKLLNNYDLTKTKH